SAPGLPVVHAPAAPDDRTAGAAEQLDQVLPAVLGQRLDLELHLSPIYPPGRLRLHHLRLRSRWIRPTLEMGPQAGPSEAHPEMTRRFWSIYAVVLALVLPGGATIIWDEPGRQDALLRVLVPELVPRPAGGSDDELAIEPVDPP